MTEKQRMSVLRILVSVIAIFSYLFMNISQVSSSYVTSKPVDVPDSETFPATIHPKPFLAAVPSVTLGGLGTAPVGSNVSFTVSFKNNDADTGYGPYIDLILDTTGPDGLYPGTSTPTDYTYDGLGNDSISASYLGIPFVLNSTMWVIELDENGQASHPLARDINGDPIVVTAPAEFEQGDQLVVIRLPFGSFVNTQPAAVVDVTVDMSELADIGTDLYVSARGGFQYGQTELDDWCCDLVVDTISGWNTDSVIPTLFELTKTYSGPESEAAAGPNFRTFYPMRYTVTASIAAGQSMNNLVLTDVIPSNLQSYSLVSSSPAGASCSTIPSSPGGSVVCDWGSTSISGSASLTFDFYIPQGTVPVSGASVESCNNASSSAYWDSPDGRDLDQTIVEEPAGCEHTLQDRSIAVQKGVTVQGGGDPAPGKVQVYTLNFQVSDYFAFNNLSVVDVLSDGQHFDNTFTPTLTVTENTNTSSDGMDSANYSVNTSEIGNDVDPSTDGSTSVTFNVSNELIHRSLDGILLGGCVPSGGGSDTDCDPYNGGATSGTIVFHAIVQEEFTDTYPSGDASVDQGDELGNTVTATGDVLDTSTLVATGATASDGSATNVSIGYGNLSKSILAITNGNNGEVTLNPTSVKVKPGDKVTFRLAYSLPTSDFEDLVITDYLPLPVFDADEMTTTSVEDTCDDLGYINDVPDAGISCFGSGDDYHDLVGAINPSLTVLSGGNSIIWNYGDYDAASNPDSDIVLVFTVTVTTAPFADGLYLTNQANAVETSTQSNSSAENSIVQIQLTEPVLVSSKGIVATDNTNPTVTFSPNPPAPFTFTAPGSSGARWAGVISSSTLTTTPINSDISGVDAGDLVTFAIVIQNNGSSINGAFDIDIKDVMNTTAFEYPSGGINLRVSYGDSSLTPIAYTKPDGSGAGSTDLFGGGIRLVDPSGAGVCQAHDPNSGNNVIILTYDLQLKSTVQPGTYTNTGTIVNYSGSEGGTDFANPDLEDEAQVTTAVMEANKTLVGTELASTHNSATQGVIGELVNYQVVITVPEGILPSLTVDDVLDTGLAFVGCTSISASTGLATNIGGSYSTDFSSICPTTPQEPAVNPTVSSDARTIGFSLGNIQNSNTDNSTAETITIGYQAVVLNLASNQSGVTLNNQVTVTSGDTTINDSADNVTIIEPAPTVSKAATINGGSVGLPGQTVVYTITIANATGTDAYDVAISDPLPQVANPSLPADHRSLITLPVAPNTLNALSVTDSAGTLTSANFNFAGDNTNGWTLSSNASFNVPVGRSIVLTITGTLVNDGTPAVSANQLIRNTANMSWTSLSGLTEVERSVYSTDSSERNGTDGIGGLNDYTTSDDGDISVTDITVTKQLIDSAGNVLAGQSVRVGDTIYYRNTITIPRDIFLSGMTFADTMDAGLAFVTCRSITAEAGLTTTVTNGFTCSNPTTSITGSGTDGGRYVNISFGDVQNTDTASARTIVIEYSVVVLDTAAVNRGDSLNNAVSVGFSVNGGSHTRTANAPVVTVTEPTITVTKTASPDTGDAGDTITFTIVVTASSGANFGTAYDVTMSDTLPSGYTYVPASVSTSAGTTPTTGPTYSYPPGMITAGWDSLAPGDTTTFTYSAVLVPAVIPDQVITNTAAVTYTSLPGTIPQQSTYNVYSYERTGDSTLMGSTSGSFPQNDYLASASESVTVNPSEMGKVLTTTSESTTSGNNLAIGETATFMLTVTLPEGTTPSLTVTDLIPTGMAYVTGSYSIDTSGFNGTLPVPSVTALGGNGDDLTLSFGEIIVDDDGILTNNSFTVQLQAVVLNVIGNQRNTSLVNQASVQVGTGTIRYSPQVTMTVVEPVITFTKTIVDFITPLDAGGVVHYRISYANATGAVVSTALDVNITDALASALLLSSTGSPDLVITTSGSVGAITNSSTTSNINISIASVAPGASVTVDFYPVIQTSITPGQVVNNSSISTWTSLTGTVSGERTGAGGVNDYTLTRSVSFTASSTIGLVKSIYATSESTTSVTDVAIGETITYNIVLTFPEGTIAADTVVDDLPTGLQIIGGTPQVITSAAGSGGALTADFGGTIGAYMITTDTSDGGRVQFDFNNVVASGDNVTTNNSILLQFQAQVTNIMANQAGTVISNTASNQIGTSTPTNSNTVTVTVVEPVITFTKTIVSTPSPLDAGGVVHYQISYANGTGATISTALNVNITDALASELLLPSTGAPDLVITPSAGVGAITNSSTTSNINISIASVAPGASVIVDFYPVIQNSITIGQIVDNTGVSTWTSLTGTVSGERTGAGGVNDYTLTRTVPFTASSAIGLVKSIYATSESTTSVTDVAIGETITYNIVLTFPEGTIAADTVVDDLPTGLQIIGGTPQVITSAAGSGGALTADFGGTIGAYMITTDTSDGGRVQFDFNNVVASGDNVTTNNSILLQFQAQVTNIMANQAGTVISNTASNQIGTSTPTNSNTVTVTVVEPVITFTKTIVSTPSPLDAGGVVHYQISYANGSGATISTALNVNITDALASELLLPSTGAPDLVITPSAGVGAITNSSTTSNINISIASVAPGASVTVDYYPVIQESITLGEVVSNSGISTWTSLTGTVSGERTGAGGVNDYTANDIETFTNSGDVTISKSIATTSETGTSGTDVAVGEIVTYNIILTFPEGTTPADTVLDDLPAGLQLVSGSPQVIVLAASSGGALAEDFNGSNYTPSITSDTSDGGSVQYDFTNVIVTGDNNPSNNAILLRFDAVVTNIIANQDGTSISNTASNTVGANTPTDSNTVTVTVVEPVINITKTVDDDTPGYNQTLTFTISLEHDATSTSGAYDLVVTDIVPAELAYVAGSMTAPTGWTMDESAAPTLTWRCLSTNVCSIPTGSPAINLGYQAVVDSASGSFLPGALITNTAGATWTSLSTVSTDERTGAGGVNDYVASDSNQSTLSYPDLEVTKTDGVVVYVPGGSVTYTIVVTNSGNIADSGSEVSDPIPPEVTSWTWTCTEAGGATGCSAVTDSTTDFIDTVDLPVDSSITYTVTANLNSAAATMTDPDLVNTVTVAVSGGGTDATPGNNIATDTDTPNSQADLWTTKTDHISLYAPPATLTYTIEVGNDGPSDAPGSLVTDVKPVQFGSWDWDCTTLTGGAGECTEQTNLTGNFTDTVDLPSGATITYTVTARLTAEAMGTLINSVVIDPPTLVSDSDLSNNTATDIDQPGAGVKTFNGSNQTFTSGQSVAIGEIITYRVVLDVAGMTGTDPTVINNLQLVDTMDQGLAYVDCLSITATDASLHPVSGNFASICANPTVEVEPTGSSEQVNAGRKVTWNFGSIENNGEIAQTLIVEYRAVVLDAQGVTRGSTLNNSAVWTWQGGQITSSAVDVTVVEPMLTLTKTANATVLINGATVTYTLTVGYDSSSNIDGYDVVLTDVIPEGLTYVPGSLVISSGYSDGSTTIDETSAPTLHVTWPTFPSGSQAVIQYQVTVGVLPLGREYTNTANVSWTSLPGDYSSPQSSHNLLSVERYYDPTSSVDIYGVQAALTLPTPGIPDTGFAQGRTTLLGIQPEEKEYNLLSDMVLEIPTLGLKLPITGIPFVDNEWDLTWLASQAGYLQGSAFPTHAGNSIITGHVYLPDGKPGPFVDLNTLQYGDQIIIHAYGQKYIYDVREWQQVLPNNQNVFRHEKYPVVTLLTCQGYDEVTGKYTWRYLVRAVQVKVENE